MPKLSIPLNREALQSRISFIEESLLEKYKIITPEYARKKLVRMAGYRNRMVHFYGEITEKEIYKIIQEELQDFYAFLSFVGKVLKEPSKFNLTVSQE